MKKILNNEILWAKLNPNAIIPTKTQEDAGYDIYPCFDEDYIIIKSGETKLIQTGIACGLNEGYYLQLEERGSTGSKGIKSSAGVIDSGYRGEIFVALTNCNNKDIVITKTASKFDDTCDDVVIYPYTKAICQGIVHKVLQLESKEVSYDELKSYTSNRGEGKLGSSGK